MASRNLFSFSVPHCLQWSLCLPPFGLFGNNQLLFYIFMKQTIITATGPQNSLPSAHLQISTHRHGDIHIHVSVSDLYIPMIGLHILLEENMWTDPGNI